MRIYKICLESEQLDVNGHFCSDNFYLIVFRILKIKKKIRRGL